VKKGDWFSQVCELEREGRANEARRLFEENTTPAEREGYQAATRALAEAFAKISPEAIAESEEIMKRFRALKDLPEDHPKRRIWDQFWESSPAFMASFWRYLPDPTANPGRPKNSRKITEEMLAEMDRQRSLDVLPTAAAKEIVGDIAGQKNRADHLVRVWKRSRGIK